MPSVSHTITSVIPQLQIILAILRPAAPAPAITTLHSFQLRSERRRALMRPAIAAIEVPCWSSWKTERIFSQWRLLQIVKHSGALKSYKLTALYKWMRSRMASTANSGVFLLLMHTGTTLASPKSLNSMDLTYITGKPGMGPILPSPSTEVPSVRITLSLDVTQGCASPSENSLLKFSRVKQFYSFLILQNFKLIPILPPSISWSLIEHASAIAFSSKCSQLSFKGYRWQGPIEINFIISSYQTFPLDQFFIRWANMQAEVSASMGLLARSWLIFQWLRVKKFGMEWIWGMSSLSRNKTPWQELERSVSTSASEHQGRITKGQQSILA